MIVTSQPTQNTLYTNLRSFIMGIVTGVEVVQGLGNRVPMPKDAFIAITAISQKKLSTNIHQYYDPFPAIGGDKVAINPTQYSIQIDCYGEKSSDWATQISTLLRDDFGISLLQCLYCSEPTQAPLTSGEDSYIQRWIVTAELQVNFEVKMQQEFFDKPGEVNLIEVDTHFKA